MDLVHSEEKHRENNENNLWKPTRTNNAQRETKSSVGRPGSSRHAKMRLEETERGGGRFLDRLSTSVGTNGHVSK